MTENFHPQTRMRFELNQIMSTQLSFVKQHQNKYMVAVIPNQCILRIIIDQMVIRSNHSINARILCRSLYSTLKKIELGPHLHLYGIYEQYQTEMC